MLTYLSDAERFYGELNSEKCYSLSEMESINNFDINGLDESISYDFAEFSPLVEFDLDQVLLSDEAIKIGITPEIILKVLGGEENYPLPQLSRD